VRHVHRLSESSPRNDLDTQVNIAQALKARNNQATLRPPRPLFALPRVLIAGCAVGMVWALQDGLKGQSKAYSKAAAVAAAAVERHAAFTPQVYEDVRSLRRQTICTSA
jgi:hypothetical protein